MSSYSRFISLVLALFSFVGALAQAPDGIQFQAVARDGSGTPINSASITVDFRIQDGSATTVYHETHSTTTDAYGLFSLVIGQGTPISGNFNSISWGNSQHQVQIDVDAGAGYVPMGICSFQSVPYALYAENGSVWSSDSYDTWYNQGRVGIGIDTPVTSLHLPDTSNFLIGENVTGSGFKMLYYAAKGAFRVGYLNNPFGGYNYNKFWDYDSVGYYSFAAGQNSRAKGFGSFAFGSFGWADGSGSVAFFGNAKGNNSYTFGGSSKGRGSFTVEGVADEEGGIAMYGYTGGRYGVSIGGGTTGLGASSSREDYAIAIGWNSDARGQASIALGPSDAYGYNSFSTGWVTEARGNYSSTFGYQTNSYPYASMALGRFNHISGDSASWVSSDPIFIVGDGTSNGNRSNSFLIQKNGQTSIGYNYPTGMLNVSTALGSLNNGGSLDMTNASVLVGSTSTGLGLDANQIETAGSTLHLNYSSDEDVTMGVGGGSVGIGTASPGTKMDIESSGWQLRIANTGAGGEDWYIGSSHNTWASGGGRFVISKNSGSANDVFVIDGDDQIGLGTNSPVARLQVDALTGEDALRARVNGNTKLMVHDNGGVSVGINVTPPSNGLAVAGHAIPSSNGIFNLGSNTRRWMTVYATNGTIQTSDIRLKKDIENSPYGLNELMQLRPVSYFWKDEQMGQVRKIGFVAQEIQPIIPEVVIGNVEAEPLGVNYAELVPILVKAVQEQQTEIEILKAEIEKLKNQDK